MQATFALAGPKPSSISTILLVETACAGFATNAQVTFIFERVFGQFVLHAIFVDHFRRPTEQWVKSSAAMERILLDAQVLAMVCLLASHSGNPDVMSNQQRLQRFDLVDMTTAVRVGGKEEVAFGIELLDLGNGRFDFDQVQVQIDQRSGLETSEFQETENPY